MIIGLLRCRRFRMETSRCGDEMASEYLQTSKFTMFYPCSRKKIDYLHLYVSTPNLMIGSIAIGYCRVFLHSLVSTEDHHLQTKLQPRFEQDSKSHTLHSGPSLHCSVHTRQCLHAKVTLETVAETHFKHQCLGGVRYPMLLSNVMISQTMLDTSLAPLLTNCPMNKTAAWKKTVTFQCQIRLGWNHVFKQRLDILLLGCKEVRCGQMQMLHTAIVPGSTDSPGPIL